MGFFSKNEGGLMDVIRCDEQEYLVWKWRPKGATVNDSKKENSIRYGSSLRVKDGEVAVFVYKQKDGTVQDYIVGPYDQTIKTANFPVLASIVGLAFAGDSPFQAEIYFINLAGNVQIKFGIPYFDIYDPRYIDLGIPCAVRGTLTFNITDYITFTKLNRLINFELEDFKKQIKDVFIRKTKSVVLNVPQDAGIPVMQIERKIDEISDVVQSKLNASMQDDFGVNLKRLDIGTVELDKEHPHYQQLKKATADQQTKLSEAKMDVEIENLSETARIQRKSMELGVEGSNFAVHQLNQQTNVLQTAAESMGKMGGTLGTRSSDGGLNPAGIMTGMMMGGAIGGQMAGMMNQMGQNMNQQTNQPPVPPPQITYCISVNGQTSPPYTLQQLQQLFQSGQLTRETYIWKQGMANWEMAGNVAEIAGIFSAVPPPPPI